MAKPIAVIYIPPEGAFGKTAEKATKETMKLLNGNYGRPDEEEGVSYPTYWTEYYWFVFVKHDIDVPQITVLYDKDFTPVNFEELKQYLEKALKINEPQP